MKEFEEVRKPHMRGALNARIVNLEEKRKAEKTERNIRPSPKAPRSIAEARTGPKFKEWAASHDAKLARHDTEIRT